MSLINLRHLSAPLRSKFQIGAIVIFGLLVLIIRWGSGSNSGISNTNRPTMGQNALQKKAIIELLQEPSEEDSITSEAGSDPFLDDLVSGNFDQRTRSGSRREGSPGKGAFQDIRKSLGLQ